MKNKGITLLALIVTVIIMLILAGVTINLVNNNGTIQKTKEAVNLYNESSEKEELELAKIAATDFATGEVDKDLLEENLPEGWTVDNDWDGTIICISPSGKEFSGIGTSEFIVEIKDKFGNKYKYYRLDKVTDEQREKCREQGIPMLLGDGNSDGKVNDQDLDVLKNIAGNRVSANEYQEIILDLTDDELVDVCDISELQLIIKDFVPLRMVAIAKEVEISRNLINQDEETGELFFWDENVEAPIAEKLEKYGVIGRKGGKIKPK